MKSKSRSWIKLFQLILFKINHSFTAMFLLLFSLLFSVLTPLILFSVKISADNFLINFQYYFMIFYNIILFIFAALNAIKIFGVQIEDSSFLLLITKPYSRKNIILTQYTALFFMNFIFILLNVLVLLMLGGLCSFTFHDLYLNFYVITVLKFFVFTFCFSILLTVGVVVLLSFIRSQNVFLIFIIFCSLFLLGGLPYSLTKLKTDNIIFTFADNQAYNVAEIKNAILFKENLKNNLIKYHNLTSAIFNFYVGLSLDEINNINSKPVIDKRIDFFRNLGFIEEYPVVKSFKGKTTVWRPVTYQNQTINMQITFNSYFKSLADLTANANNKIFADLLNIINDYRSQCSSINTFMAVQKTKATTLLTYDDDINATFISIENKPKQKLADNQIRDIFFSNDEYQFAFRDDFNKIFYNPVYYVIRTVEDYISQQVCIYDNISNNNIINNNNYQKYISTVNTYQMLNKINVIEHWNQLWTYFMGDYGDFWFEIYPQSSIDFDSQKNNLFSYHDFKLALFNGKINTKQIVYFQNITVIIYFYITITFVLFYLSYLMFLKKKIS